MAVISLHFNVHQPNRLRPYTFFEIGKEHFYENDLLNKEVLNRVAANSYLPANALFKSLLEKHEGKFRLALTLSGIFLEQLEAQRPDVLDSFKRLVATGYVDLYATPYFHSLACIYSEKEFERQVALHVETIKKHFNLTPTVFRNTELIYSNELALKVAEMGFKAIVSDDVPYVLNGRSANYLYKAPNTDKIKIAVRNSKLSDDLAFRFKDQQWSEYPLTGDKFSHWLQGCDGDVVNLTMDYETVGEFHPAGTGIFQFFDHFVNQAVSEGVEFTNISKAADTFDFNGLFDAHFPVSGADSERDLSAWNGNAMQDEAIAKVYSLEETIRQLDDPNLWHIWGKLQTSDHFYYLSTKAFEDGAVHQAKSPYSSPYDGYIYFMNALSDLEITLKKAQANKPVKKAKGKKKASKA